MKIFASLILLVALLFSTVGGTRNVSDADYPGSISAEITPIPFETSGIAAEPHLTQGND